MKKTSKIIIPFLLLFALFSCSNSYDGKYMFKDNRWQIEIELDNGVMHMYEIDEKGQTREGFEYKANYHINDDNIIVLDKMLKGRDSLEFQTAWNNVKIEINDDGIEFYEDFDRNDEKMFFTKIK